MTMLVFEADSIVRRLEAQRRLSGAGDVGVWEYQEVCPVCPDCRDGVFVAIEATAEQIDMVREWLG